MYKVERLTLYIISIAREPALESRASFMSNIRLRDMGEMQS
jgi:hypothetical protein